MSTTTWHPSERLLHRWIDEELAGGERARVESHVHDCPRCAGVTQELRSLGDAMRAIAPPRAPARDGLEQVLARRRAGDCVVLPVGPARRSPRRTWLGVVSVAAAVLLGVVAVFVPSRDGAPVAASRLGSLALSPARPVPGASVDVRYRASGDLQGAPRLVLRALWWRGTTAQRDDAPVVAAQLVRASDGVHRGELVVPRDARFGALLVERPDGTIIEAPDGGYGMVIPTDADGRPDADGLRIGALVAIADAATSGRPRALRLAEEYVERHPSLPSAWALVAMLQGTESPSRDIVATFVARVWRLRRLAAAMDATPDAPPSELLALAEFAWTLEEPALARRMIERVLADSVHDDARSLRAVGNAVRRAAAWRERPLARAQGLAVLERAWARAARPSRDVAVAAIHLVQSAPDSAAFARWRARAVAAARPEWLPYDFPRVRRVLASAMLDEYRQLLARPLPDSSTWRPLRPLDVTTDEWERRRHAGRALLLLRHGTLLLETGALGAALDTLERANAIRPLLLLRQGRVLADARLAAGDTAAAMAAYAIDGWFAAARGSGAERARRDSVRRMVGRHWSDAAWTRGLDSARALRALERSTQRGERPHVGSVGWID